ncbi:uncharacterized protein BDZ99DRAFT_494548 [Mytilinidion resinicola]|uniref:Uncharacterized protein n=1 Tax=Mytilinidion resinicola TaxID=574789 RepID=A0A6A6Z2Y0_9PEZI|nr:uncharacterized protein BDZ99DRAFT_494548 [Mytilinidion resinicola]KAF2814597.1 hypothetical protein BDZ99DRAFT_494548 [Mytilinidion resinicola]
MSRDDCELEISDKVLHLIVHTPPPGGEYGGPFELGHKLEGDDAGEDEVADPELDAPLRAEDGLLVDGVVDPEAFKDGEIEIVFEVVIEADVGDEFVTTELVTDPGAEIELEIGDDEPLNLRLPELTLGWELELSWRDVGDSVETIDGLEMPLSVDNESPSPLIELGDDADDVVVTDSGPEEVGVGNAEVVREEPDKLFDVVDGTEFMDGLDSLLGGEETPFPPNELGGAEINLEEVDEVFEVTDDTEMIDRLEPLLVGGVETSFPLNELGEDEVDPEELDEVLDRTESVDELELLLGGGEEMSFPLNELGEGEAMGEMELLLGGGEETPFPLKEVGEGETAKDEPELLPGGEEPPFPLELKKLGEAGDVETGEENALEDAVPDGLLLDAPDDDTGPGEEGALESELKDRLLLDPPDGDTEAGEEITLENELPERLLLVPRDDDVGDGEEAELGEIATERVVGVVVGTDDGDPETLPEVVADTEAGLVPLVVPRFNDVGDGEEAALEEITTEKVVGIVVGTDNGDSDALPFDDGDPEEAVDDKTEEPAVKLVLEALLKIPDTEIDTEEEEPVLALVKEKLLRVSDTVIDIDEELEGSRYATHVPGADTNSGCTSRTMKKHCDEIPVLGCVAADEESVTPDRLLDAPCVDVGDDVDIFCEKLLVADVMLGDETPVLDPVLAKEEIVVFDELLGPPDVKVGSDTILVVLVKVSDESAEELPVFDAVLRDGPLLEEEFPGLEVELGAEIVPPNDEDAVDDWLLGDEREASEEPIVELGAAFREELLLDGEDPGPDRLLDDEVLRDSKAEAAGESVSEVVTPEELEEPEKNYEAGTRRRRAWRRLEESTLNDPGELVGGIINEGELGAVERLPVMEKLLLTPVIEDEELIDELPIVVVKDGKDADWETPLVLLETVRVRLVPEVDRDRLGEKGLNAEELEGRRPAHAAGDEVKASALEVVAVPDSPLVVFVVVGDEIPELEPAVKLDDDVVADGLLLTDSILCVLFRSIELTIEDALDDGDTTAVSMTTDAEVIETLLSELLKSGEMTIQETLDDGNTVGLSLTETEVFEALSELLKSGELADEDTMDDVGTTLLSLRTGAEVTEMFCGLLDSGELTVENTLDDSDAVELSPTAHSEVTEALCVLLKIGELAKGTLDDSDTTLLLLTTGVEVSEILSEFEGASELASELEEEVNERETQTAAHVPGELIDTEPEIVSPEETRLLPSSTPQHIAADGVEDIELIVVLPERLLVLADVPEILSSKEDSIDDDGSIDDVSVDGETLDAPLEGVLDNDADPDDGTTLLSTDTDPKVDETFSELEKAVEVTVKLAEEDKELGSRTAAHESGYSKVPNGDPGINHASSQVLRSSHEPTQSANDGATVVLYYASVPPSATPQHVATYEVEEDEGQELAFSTEEEKVEDVTDDDEMEIFRLLPVVDESVAVAAIVELDIDGPGEAKLDVESEYLMSQKRSTEKIVMMTVPGSRNSILRILQRSNCSGGIPSVRMTGSDFEGLEVTVSILEAAEDDVKDSDNVSEREVESRPLLDSTEDGGGFKEL